MDGQNGSGGELSALTTAQAAVYDRQIRLWGVEAQQRLSRASVLVCGFNGSAAEMAKNLVLSGVSVTLVDAGRVAAGDLTANFFLQESDVGQPRVQAALPRVQELNPLVSVNALAVDVGQVTEKQVAEHQVVVLVNQAASEQRRVDALCRAAGSTLFAVEAHGAVAVACVDWSGGSHRFVKVNDRGDVLGEPQQLESPSLAGLLDADWGAMHRGMRFGLHRLFAPMVALRRAVDAGPAGADAAPAAAAVLRDKGLPESDLVAHVWAQWGSELSPACSVVAGLLSQEVLKAITGRGAPFGTALFFDVLAGEAAGQRLALS